MAAQPQPPERGGMSHRLRALMSSHGQGSAQGSGALIEPRPPDQYPPLPGQQMATPTPLRPSRPASAVPPPPPPPPPPSPDADGDGDDLAPTLPQIPSIPRLRAVETPATVRTRVAADFAAFLLSRNYIHGPRLDGLTIEQRMRLVIHVGRIYMPALSLAGRMPPVDDVDGGVAG